MLDQIARWEPRTGHTAWVLGQWRAAARNGWPGIEHSDCCGMPYSRNDLEALLHRLPPFAAERVRRIIEPIDREYLRRTLPFPLAAPWSAWWFRRCPPINYRANVPSWHPADVAELRVAPPAST